MYEHQPVLLREVVAYLEIKANGVYVDATFGRGGHSQEILKRLGSSGRLIVIDKDDEAIKVAKKNFSQDKRVSIQQGSFTMLKKFLTDLNLVGKVDGLLFDLGVSSPQLDDPVRGFSFLRDGPLDMRMDITQTLNAKTWVNQADQTEIARVLKEFGEERFAKRIAGAIVLARELQPIETTGQLADIVSKAHPAWEKHKHPATRTFQAIRILVNNELNEITDALQQGLEILKVGGKLLAISFHSLEDRVVKSFIRKQERGNIPERVPVLHHQTQSRVRRIAWGIRASDEELALNPRSRSAILRVVEKLQ